MKHLTDDFRWSFSKLAAFLQCPMSFYLQYVENPGRDDELPGYFSQYGTLMHSILERYYKDETPVFCLADEWRERYDNEVTITPPPFPAGFGEKNYNAAVDYLENFEGLAPGWEVIAVEKKFVIDIEGYKVSGIADLVTGCPEDHEVVITDHKTKSKASMKKEYQLYRKQLYLYAIWLKEEYGDWPTKLRFNMVKDDTYIEEDFDIDMVEETKKWFVDTIHKIEECDLFEAWSTCIADKDYEQGKELYFCKHICGVNPVCDRYQDCHRRAIDAWLAKKAEEEAMYLGGV